MSDRQFPLANLVNGSKSQLVDGRAGVVLAERRPEAIVEVAAWPDAEAKVAKALAKVVRLDVLPETGRVATAPDLVVLRLGPGRLQFVSQDAALADRLGEVVTPDLGAVVDLGHARAGLRLGGPAAQDVLQNALSFDLDMRTFPELSVAQSAIHHMGATVVRMDAETFDVFVFRGFAGSLWDWARDAAVEFGWTVGAPV